MGNASNQHYVPRYLPLRHKALWTTLPGFQHTPVYISRRNQNQVIITDFNCLEKKSHNTKVFQINHWRTVTQGGQLGGKSQVCTVRPSAAIPVLSALSSHVLCTLRAVVSATFQRKIRENKQPSDAIKTSTGVFHLLDAYWTCSCWMCWPKFNSNQGISFSYLQFYSYSVSGYNEIPITFSSNASIQPQHSGFVHYYFPRCGSSFPQSLKVRKQYDHKCCVSQWGTHPPACFSELTFLCTHSWVEGKGTASQVWTLTQKDNRKRRAAEKLLYFSGNSILLLDDHRNGPFSSCTHNPWCSRQGKAPG